MSFSFYRCVEFKIKILGFWLASVEGAFPHLFKNNDKNIKNYEKTRTTRIKWRTQTIETMWTTRTTTREKPAKKIKKRQKKTWFTLRTKKSLHLLAHNNEQYEQQIKQKTRIRRTTAARVRRTLRIVTTKQWEEKDQEEKLRTSRTTQVIKN